MIELPSMDSNIDGATLESIDLSAISTSISAPISASSDQSALIVHPSQELILKYFQKLKVVTTKRIKEIVMVLLKLKSQHLIQLHQHGCPALDLSAKTVSTPIYKRYIYDIFTKFFNK